MFKHASIIGSKVCNHFLDCANCGAEFRRQNTDSELCKKCRPVVGVLTRVICDYCDKPFMRPTTKGNQKYCDDPCKNAARTEQAQAKIYDRYMIFDGEGRFKRKYIISEQKIEKVERHKLLHMEVAEIERYLLDRDINRFRQKNEPFVVTMYKGLVQLWVNRVA